MNKDNINEKKAAKSEREIEYHQHKLHTFQEHDEKAATTTTTIAPQLY